MYIMGRTANVYSVAQCFWAEIYSHLVLSHQARSTRTKRISYIDGLYEYADSAYGVFQLDRAITNVDVPGLSKMLQGYLVHLNNRASINDIDGSSILMDRRAGMRRSALSGAQLNCLARVLLQRPPE